MRRRHLEVSFGPGPDDLQDGLGLGQIETAGKVRPQGKFSRVGQTRPRGQGQVQDAPQDPITRMAVDFHHVFPGIGVGRPHEGKHDFIDDFTLGVIDVAQIEPVGLPRRAGAMGTEEAMGDGEGLGAAQPDDADPRLAQRGADSRNGIGRTGGGHAEPAASSRLAFFLAGEITTFL